MTLAALQTTLTEQKVSAEAALVSWDAEVVAAQLATLVASQAREAAGAKERCLIQGRDAAMSRIRNLDAELKAIAEAGNGH